MSRQIIVLDVNTGDGGYITTSALFWFPAVNPIPQPGKQSAFRNCSADETTALQSGAIIEENKVFQFPASFTQIDIQAHLVQFFNSRQAWLAGQLKSGQFYGLSYDPFTTTWK